MPAQILLNDRLELRMFSMFGDQLAVNVVHLRCSAIVGAGVNVLELANEAALQWVGAYKAVLSTQADYIGLKAQRIFPIPKSLAENSIVGIGVGDIAGDALPRQVSGIITKQSLTVGRANRGRFYMPFPAEADGQALAVPTTSYVLRLVALGQALSTPFVVTSGANTMTFVPVIWRRTTLTSIDWITARASPRWATQRRRGSFGRPNLRPDGL